MNLPSFKDFCSAFVEQIDSAAFGEPQNFAPEHGDPRKSPASRELHNNTGMSHHLRKPLFLRTIYNLMREHQRLEAERQKVRPYEKSLRPLILRNKKAQKRLLTLANLLKDSFLSKYRSLLGDQLEQEIYSIAEKIEDVAFSLKQREKSYVSQIHPAIRRKGDEPSRWSPILKDVEYDLSKISVKAPDQWLYEQIDDELKGMSKRKQNYALTQMTRMKLIAALIKAARIACVEPVAIKEFLKSRKRSVKTNLEEK